MIGVGYLKELEFGGTSPCISGRGVGMDYFQASQGNLLKSFSLFLLKKTFFLIFSRKTFFQAEKWRENLF